METKICRSCKENKNVNLFYKRNSYSYRGICKQCANTDSKNWSAQNPERRKEIIRKSYEKIGRTKRSENTIRSRMKNISGYLLKSAKDRALKTGLCFDLKPEDVIIPKVCPVFNVPLVYGTDFAASIDRIDPLKGYTKDNIQILSKKANVMKSNASQQELEQFAKWVLHID